MGWVAVSATAHPAATHISALALLLHPRPTPAAPPDTAAKPQPVPASASKRRVPRITRKTSPPETVRQATHQAVPGSQSTQHKAGEWEGDAGTKNPPLEQRLGSTTSPGPSTCANPSRRNSQDATAPRRGPRQVRLCHPCPKWASEGGSSWGLCGGGSRDCSGAGQARALADQAVVSLAECLFQNVWTSDPSVAHQL